MGFNSAFKGLKFQESKNKTQTSEVQSKTYIDLCVHTYKYLHMKTPIQCHCLFSAVCGALSTLAVNGNTTLQGVSPHRILCPLSEGGAIYGLTTYNAKFIDYNMIFMVPCIIIEFL
jgi:hypothetical protein